MPPSFFVVFSLIREDLIDIQTTKITHDYISDSMVIEDCPRNYLILIIFYNSIGLSVAKIQVILHEYRLNCSVIFLLIRKRLLKFIIQKKPNDLHVYIVAQDCIMLPKQQFDAIFSLTCLLIAEIQVIL